MSEQRFSAFSFLAVLALAALLMGAATKIRLTTQVTGILPIANGGTGTLVGLASEIYPGFCLGTIGTGNGSAYPLPPANSSQIGCTSTQQVEPPMPFACTAKNLYARSLLGGAQASSGIVKIYKNNAATAVTCTMGTGTSCNDTTNSVTFAQGDLWSIRVLTGQATDTITNPRAMFQCI